MDLFFVLKSFDFNLCTVSTVCSSKGKAWKHFEAPDTLNRYKRIRVRKLLSFGTKATSETPGTEWQIHFCSMWQSFCTHHFYIFSVWALAGYHNTKIARPRHRSKAWPALPNLQTTFKGNLFSGDYLKYPWKEKTLLIIYLFPSRINRLMERRNPSKSRAGFPARKRFSNLEPNLEKKKKKKALTLDTLNKTIFDSVEPLFGFIMSFKRALVLKPMPMITNHVKMWSF